nr:uncharacterized protein LOC121125741 [Lepeophtheirus salmonis]
MDSSYASDEDSEEAVDNCSKRLMKKKSSGTLNVKILNEDVRRKFKKQMLLKQKNAEWQHRWEEHLKNEPFTQSNDVDITASIVSTDFLEKESINEMDSSELFIQHLNNIDKIRSELQTSKTKHLHGFKFPPSKPINGFGTLETTKESNNSKYLTGNLMYVYSTTHVDTK